MKRIFAVLVTTVLISICSLPTSAAEPKTISSSKYDLDGDGMKDKLTVVFGDFDSVWDVAFTITVNGQTIKGSGDSVIWKTFIVDIDKKDGKKEIAICDNGPSEDPVTRFYGFDQGKLYDLGQLEGNLEYGRLVFKINGDGTVTTPCRSRILQTWWFTAQYRLDTKNHEFLLVEQDVYPSTRAYRLMVKKPFKAYSAKDDASKTFVLKKGAVITLTGTDEKQWVRFKDSKGKVGWIRLETYAPDSDGWWWTDRIDGYGYAADYLDGLEYFD